jgi:hypothetical protein
MERMCFLGTSSSSLLVQHISCLILLTLDVVLPALKMGINKVKVRMLGYIRGS